MDTLTSAIQHTVEAAVLHAMAEWRRPIQREALTIAETAEALGRSRDWVRQQIDAGEIPAKQTGDRKAVLIPLRSLREWLEVSP